MAKSKKVGKGIAIFIAIIIGIVIVGGCSAYITGCNLTGEKNPAKWGQKGGKNESGDGDVMPVDEGFLMFKPLTAVDSPVAIEADTAESEGNTATLTATLEPENAFYSSASWRSSSNALTVTQDEENPLKATVELTGTLTQTAQITCMVVSFKTVTATCSVDYLDTSVSVGFNEIVSQNSKYSNPTEDNKYAFAFGTEYSFNSVDYSSTKSTVQGTNVITRIALIFNPNLPARTFESEINRALKISSTGWFKTPQAVSLYDNSNDSGKFTFPATFEDLIGKLPTIISFDNFAKGFYLAYGNSPGVFSLLVTTEITYNDVVYKTSSKNYAITFVPESYLTGVDGVEITPGGGVVVTG